MRICIVSGGMLRPRHVPCGPCRGSGRIVIVPPAEAQLGGVWMSLSEAKRVIAEKRGGDAR